MTFLEAAIEVLKQEGKALHFKDLTKIAIKHELLSVIGRNPELAMQARLEEEAKRPTSELLRVGPNIFGLRFYPPREAQPVPPKKESQTMEDAERPPRGLSDDNEPGRRGRGRPRRVGEAAATGPEAGLGPLTPAPTPQADEVTQPRRRGRRLPPQDRAGDPHDEGGEEHEAAAGAQEVRVKEAVHADDAPAPARAREAEAVAHRAPVASALIAPNPVLMPAALAPPHSGRSPERSGGGGSGGVAGSSAGFGSGSAGATAGVSGGAAGVSGGPTGVVVGQSTAAAPTGATGASAGATFPSAGAALVSAEATAASAGASAASAGASAASAGASAVVSAGPSAGGSTSAGQADKPAPGGQDAGGGGDKGDKPGEPPARYLPLADAMIDVLRGSSEGRPLHFRQIVDIALKRRLVRGDATDLWRAMRAASIRDQRQRDSDGQRNRVKNLGQGQYVLTDKKLEPELLKAEGELLDRINRTREATRVALRRRVKALPPSAFELLMRLLLEKLGMVAAELIKRGEGVAYYAGTMNRGARSIKTLAALRSGEGEVTREAVGELRGGVRLREFDEGLLLCSGRAGAAALAEVNAGPGIEIYDQEPLTDLLIRHQIGVRRAAVPIDYLDLDLFAELLEPVV